jgi:hypothetical protein
VGPGQTKGNDRKTEGIEIVPTMIQGFNHISFLSKNSKVNFVDSGPKLGMIMEVLMYVIVVKNNSNSSNADSNHHHWVSALPFLPK